MNYIGFDVGNDELVIANPPKLGSNQDFIQCITNTVDSIMQWLSGQDTASIHIIFEATGTYSYRLAYCLDLANVAYSIITPKQSHSFAETLKIVSQNDDRDAILLRTYGIKLQPERTVFVNEQLHNLRQKRQHLSSLISQKQVVYNQLHALEFDPRADKMVVQSLEMLQTMFDTQIEAFKAEIYDLNDDEFGKIYEKLIQIIGIGPASASAIIIATNGFANFDNVKQVSKFIGTVPKTKESGKSVKTNKGIIKTGVPHLRAILYNAAKSAKRFNRACRELYNRLRQSGKPHKVAMVAVINKLLKQAFAVVKKNVDFDNNFAFAK